MLFQWVIFSSLLIAVILLIQKIFFCPKKRNGFEKVEATLVSKKVRTRIKHNNSGEVDHTLGHSIASDDSFLTTYILRFQRHSDGRIVQFYVNDDECGQLEKGLKGILSFSESKFHGFKPAN